jgi:hypothetical protein
MTMRSIRGSASLGLDQARAILGQEAREMSDADVLEACRQAEVLAHIIVEVFLSSRMRERPS